MSDASHIVTISNSAAMVSVDLQGGAIVDFHLHEGGINPLTFKREESNFQGHFLCLGRWGPPSDGEKAAGIVTHGEAVTQTWDLQPSTPKNELRMQATAPLERLHVDRLLTLDKENSVFEVTENVTNINPLGRLFNMVQHPTIGAPFLTANTIVHCNAGEGFNYKLNTNPLEYAAKWPFGIMEKGDHRDVIVLNKLDKAYSSVFSFTVKKGAKFGWITAYNPENKLLIGYLWNRVDYPWISLWQDFDKNGNIRYRGLEFGTTGMHKSYKEIIEEGNHRVFGEDSYKYIDAGETQSRSYLAFMGNTPAGFTGTGDVNFENDKLIITDTTTGKQITIQTTLKANGIPK
jgi:hypothetical protein